MYGRPVCSKCDDIKNKNGFFRAKNNYCNMVRVGSYLLVGLASIGNFIHATLLDDYVASGPAFISSQRLPSLDLNGTSDSGATKGRSWTGYALNVTSQVWLTEDDWGADYGGANAEWWHIVYVIVPSNNENPNWRLMYVTDGKNTDIVWPANGEDLGATSQLAMATGQVSVCLFQVPNYPIYFRDEANEPRNSDDDLLAKTFVRYMDFMLANNTAANTATDNSPAASLASSFVDSRTGEVSAPKWKSSSSSSGNEALDDASWIVIFPMVKAAFATMAAADELLDTLGLSPTSSSSSSSSSYSASASASASSPPPSEWLVTGASKRGWTSWLVGAVDANIQQQQKLKLKQLKQQQNSLSSSKVNDADDGGDGDDATWPYSQQRVRAIAPIVLDGLNFHSFLHLHFGAYGGWSYAMRAFVDANFVRRITLLRWNAVKEKFCIGTLDETFVLLLLRITPLLHYTHTHTHTRRNHHF